MTRYGPRTHTPKDIEAHERARTALAEGKRLLPVWRSTARMLSRSNSLNVELHAGSTSCTDGKNIYIKVPAELADMPEHALTLCGDRNEYGVLTCPACDVLENVNITIIHEIAHIIFDTFEEVTPYEQARLLENALIIGAQGQSESSRAAKIKRKIEAIPQEQKKDYLTLSNAVSPFLPLLINACEDIRVNTLMQRERPGTKVMFGAQTQKVFRDGIKNYDGTISKWSEVPPNAQAMIGVYCKVGGFDWRNAVSEEVASELDDPELDAICDKMRDATSVRSVYKLSMPLLETLRRLGFMRAEDDEEDEPDPGEGMENDSDEPQPKDQQDSGESGEGSAPQDSDAVGSGGEDEAPGSDDASESDDNADGEGEGAGDEADSEAEEASGDADDGEGDPASGDDASEGDADGESSDEGDAGSEGGDGAEGGDAGGTDLGDGTGGSGSPSEPLDGPQTADDDEGGTDPHEGAESLDNGPTDPSESPQGDGKDSAESSGAPISDDMGDPDEVERIFTQFGRHEKVQATPSEKREEAAFEDAVELAIDQMDFFDSPSLNIDGVTEHDYKERTGAWSGESYYSTRTNAITVSEGTLSHSLHRMRLMFTDNARGRVERNRRTGKVDGRVLAKRAPAGDDRLFKKTTRPGRRDYFVLIGLDISGSTSAHIGDGNMRLDMMKAAAGAKAELLSRLGIPFAMFAHSGSMSKVDIFEVKGPKERWGTEQKEALDKLVPFSANLDGHTLEYYRKVLQKRTETDRLLLYYTDGAMPAANYVEELEVLQREIKICDQMGIHLVGIGVQSDSPTEHGLDTILLNEIEDIPDVVNELRKRLMK